MNLRIDLVDTLLSRKENSLEFIRNYEKIRNVLGYSILYSDGSIKSENNPNLIIEKGKINHLTNKNKFFWSNTQNKKTEFQNSKFLS